MSALRAPLEHDVVPAGDGTANGWRAGARCIDEKLSLTFLLKTSLAKNAKDAAVLPASLETPPNCEKLRKHIAIVLDRLGKGASLVPGSSGRAPSAYLDGKEGKDGGKDGREGKE